MLLDSNIIIYSAQSENAKLRELIAEYAPAVSCCVFNLYMRRGQDARTTIILRFRVIQFSCTSAYQRSVIWKC